MPDRISAFVEAVGAEIRWKKARPLLTEEIRTHLLDQRDACMAQGMAEDEAQAEAVRQMGDPVALGADLPRAHRELSARVWHSSSSRSRSLSCPLP